MIYEPEPPLGSCRSRCRRGTAALGTFPCGYDGACVCHGAPT